MRGNTLTRSQRRRDRVAIKRLAATGEGIPRKRTYRIKAHDQKFHLVFKKTRTKQPLASIRRIATLHGLTIDRVR